MVWIVPQKPAVEKAPKGAPIEKMIVAPLGKNCVPHVASSWDHLLPVIFIRVKAFHVPDNRFRKILLFSISRAF